MGNYHLHNIFMSGVSFTLYTLLISGHPTYVRVIGHRHSALSFFTAFVLDVDRGLRSARLCSHFDNDLETMTVTMFML
jgi:hypothetical protein